MSSWLDEDYWNFYTSIGVTVLPEYIPPESQSQVFILRLVSLLVRPWRYRVAPAASEPYGLDMYFTVSPNPNPVAAYFYLILGLFFCRGIRASVPGTGNGTGMTQHSVM